MNKFTKWLKSAGAYGKPEQIDHESLDKMLAKYIMNTKGQWAILNSPVHEELQYIYIYRFGIERTWKQAEQIRTEWYWFARRPKMLTTTSAAETKTPTSCTAHRQQDEGSLKWSAYQLYSDKEPHTSKLQLHPNHERRVHTSCNLHVRNVTKNIITVAPKQSSQSHEVWLTVFTTASTMRSHGTRQGIAVLMRPL